MNRLMNRLTSEEVAERMNTVDKILANRLKQKITIQRFCLTFPRSYGHNWSSYLRIWIKTLVALNIKVLVLSHDDWYNTLPEEIFTAQQLEVLELSGFKLQLPHHGIIKFSSLRKLCLRNALLDDHFILALRENCSDLEDLTVEVGSFHLPAGTLPKLRKFLLHCFSGMVEIRAPNLKYLCIRSGIGSTLQVNNITACKALKSLSLDYVGVTDEWLHNTVSSLPNLKYLSLFSCEALKEIKISNDRLENLTLCGWQGHHNAVELDTPNLTTFSYTSSGGGGELPALNLKASGSLLMVKLGLSNYFTGRTELSRHWYYCLIKFLGNLYQSKVAIELNYLNGKAIIVPKDMRKDLLPPTCYSFLAYNIPNIGKVFSY